MKIDYRKFHIIMDFFQDISPFLEKKPLIRNIKRGSVLYVGDIHGNYQDMENAFKIAKKNQVDTVIFLGDYVDRGPNQLKCLLKVLDAFARSEGYNNFDVIQEYILEEKYPFQVIALRGNHEDTDINSSYGFKKSLLYDEEFPEFPIKILRDLYSNLPIVTTTRCKTLGIHGGIPKPRENEQVSSILKKIKMKQTPLKIYFMSDVYNRGSSNDIMAEVYQLLWNDPFFDDVEEIPVFRRSFRGPNIFEFNKTAFFDFLKVNGYFRLVRAHETVINGYEIHWDSRLIHIFSTSPYYGRVKQAAYFLEFEDGTGEIIDGNGIALKEVEPSI